MPSLPTAEIQVPASPDQALEAIDRINIGIEVEGANEEERKYYQALFRTVNKIYKEKFPEIYREGLVDKIIYTYRESDNGEVMATSAASHNPHSKIINCDSGTPITSAATAAKDRVESGMGFTVQRIVADAGSFAHEYTHQIYENLSPSDPQEYSDSSFDGTADNVFNEGLAMMMTYLTLDALKRDPRLVGLDPEGISDLKRYSSQILSGREGLRGSDQKYIQGTKLFHKIFAEAAGPPKTRDVSKGLIAMKSFVEGLDRTKTLQTGIQDSEFQVLVKAGDIDSLRSKFAR